MIVITIFVPNISSGSDNVNDKSIVAVDTSSNAAVMILTAWSSQKNGLKVSATSSSNCLTELWTNTSSVVLNSKTGVAMTGVSSNGFTGGSAVDGNYGTIYETSLNTTTLTNIFDVKVSSSTLSLPVDKYSIH